MERWHAKLICLFLIFILPLACTLIPYKVHDYFNRKGKKGEKVLSCLMCFGGGVFFSTFILHMGPEVRYILDEALIKPYNITYPVADAIMGAGFFLVFFLEKVILKCYKKRQVKKRKQREEQCYQFNKVNTKVDTAQDSVGPRLADQNGHLSMKDKANITHVSNGHIVASQPAVASSINDCPLLGTGECCNDSVEVKVQMTDSDKATLSTSNMDTTQSTSEILHSHTTRSLVLIVALSLHRIFEGMSLGLQHSTHNVWNLFVAVLCHETVIGFGLGLQFVKNGFNFKKMLITSIICSAIMPVGVAIGTALVEMGGKSTGMDLINGILQGISTGTFIYVTFFEILQEEIDPHDTSMSKFFSVFLGFLIMAALSLIPEETTLLESEVTTLTPLNLITTSALDNYN